MKLPKKTVTAASYVAGIGVIASAIVLSVLLLLSVLGLIHPRQTRITLYTPTLDWTYSGSTIVGSTPKLRFGLLDADHHLEILTLPEHQTVGVYANAPTYVILDAAGDDVTEQYDITEDFGNIVISPRSITLYAPNCSKIYDGTPLEPERIQVRGELAPGHQFQLTGANSLTLPGQEPIAPSYAILSADGQDVTDQYSIESELGTLTVSPIPLSIHTGSATATYAYQELTAPNWKHASGKLLEGHQLSVTVTTVLQDVGTVPNEALATVTDAEGRDLSHLYDIRITCGTLALRPIPLTFKTASDTKIYDGTDLSAPEFTLMDGALPTDHHVNVVRPATLTRVGTTDNTMYLQITDANGQDVTYRYDISYQYGSLTVQPRTLIIRTKSAQKVYDGTALSCNEYEILSGSLCDNEYIELLCTSLLEPGYCDNAVLSCSIYMKAFSGKLTDVTNCYRISYEYGSLEILSD